MSRARAVFLSLLLFLPFSSVFAVDPLSIVINEIAWMGTEVEGVEPKNWWKYEWIELFNPTNKEINIAGWQIENAKSKNETLTILAGKIPTKEYFLICRKEIGGCDLIESKLSLHNKYNKNGKLVLKSKPGDIIDVTPEAVNSKWPAGNNQKPKKTMERIDPLVSGLDLKNWGTSQRTGGTPKTENSLVSFQPPEEVLPETQLDPTISSKNIFINEILPSPEGPDTENEWIEISNENNYEVDLSRWQIKYTIGTPRTYVFTDGTKIRPNEFLVLHRPQTKIILKNDGDSLELLNSKGEVVHQVTYKKAPLGQSFNRTPSGWFWSTTLTPGKENIITKNFRN